MDNADAEGVPESYADSTSIGEIRFACEAVDNNENCSTSDVSHQETSCRRSRSSRNYATGQKRRKKWRGRVEEQEYAPCSSLLEMPTQEFSHVPVGCLEDHVRLISFFPLLVKSSIYRLIILFSYSGIKTFI